MKKSLVLAFFVLLLLALGACNVATEEVQVEKPPVVQPVEPVEKVPTVRELQNGKPFIYIGTGQGHPVIALMVQGFIDACEEYDADCKVLLRPGFEDSDFVALQDQALAMGASGWVSSGYGPHRPKNMQAIEKGIPVTTFHTPLDAEAMPGMLGWVATDVGFYGKAAAGAIAEQIDCKGPVAITQNTFNDVENEASESFRVELEALCPGIEILPTEIEGGEVSSAIAKAATILTANPDLTAAFGTTGGSPTTWGKALEQGGYSPGDVTVIGMDYTTPNLDLVKAGWVYALVGQPIYEETYRCVELLVDHLYGRSVSFGNVYPSPIITVDDLDKYYGYAEKLDEAMKK